MPFFFFSKTGKAKVIPVVPLVPAVVDVCVCVCACACVCVCVCVYAHAHASACVQCVDQYKLCAHELQKEAHILVLIALCPVIYLTSCGIPLLRTASAYTIEAQYISSAAVKPACYSG